jgi:N-acetylmuramoyl-L-alanine amidase
MKMFKKSVFLMGAVFLVGLAGCATAPPIKNFPYRVEQISGVSVFSLVDMCEREKVAWDYDSLSRIVILKKGNTEVRLLVGSDRAIVDKTTQRLSAPIIIKDGVVYAPVDVWSYFQPAVCPTGLAGVPSGPAYLKPIRSVVIDAGHGGKDPGAIGHYGLREKEVVLDVAQRVKNELERCGLKVFLTRDDDVFLPLYDRPAVSGERKADLFVSIHANATRSRWVQGFEAYYLSEAMDDNARALAAIENAPQELDTNIFMAQVQSLKATLWDMVYTENRKESFELANTIGKSVSRRMNMKLLGVRGAKFAVLKGSMVPAVLVEIGYISNREGERNLKDANYRQRMAQAIAEGIINFQHYAQGDKSGQAYRDI